MKTTSIGRLGPPVATYSAPCGPFESGIAWKNGSTAPEPRSTRATRKPEAILSVPVIGVRSPNIARNIWPGKPNVPCAGLKANLAAPECTGNVSSGRSTGGCSAITNSGAGPFSEKNLESVTGTPEA